MDQDLNELEQLAEGTHADLQEKPKKQSVNPLNGNPVDLKENGDEDLAKPSIDATTHASNTTSTATLNVDEKSVASTAKPSNNLANLHDQQMSQKVNQDLFYQMPDEEENNDASPKLPKDK